MSLSNPWESPKSPSDDRLLPRRWWRKPLAVWWLGYSLQLCLFAVFLLSMKTRFEIARFRHADLLFVLFNSGIVACGLLSIIAIFRLMTHRTIAARIGFAAGSVLLFGTTWFLFWMRVLSIVFS